MRGNEMSTDLVAFLTARYDEAEKNVRSEIGLSEFLGRELKDWGKYVYDPVIGPYGGQNQRRDMATGIYIAEAADPIRVLADIAAKRRVVDLHRPVGDRRYHPVRCAEDGRGYPCDTLTALASVYADHSDYRSEWKP
jgi:hypothetical protein